MKGRNMDPHNTSLVLLFTSCLFLLSFSISSSTAIPIQDSFTKCVAKRIHTPPTPTDSNSSFFFTAQTPAFDAVLRSTTFNFRCMLPSMPKPLLIFRPFAESHVAAAVTCAKKLGLHVRIRSGGHDLECLSFTSPLRAPPPFVVIDLRNLRAVDVDVPAGTAWVQAGATMGELAFRISEKSPKHGFPVSMGPFIGVGGYITGGGYGQLVRKYGLGADNVEDARIVDAKGRILDRESMGEELFWAIRGGGGGNFGIILAWKVKLVSVPPIVTVFAVPTTLEQGATKILYKWQRIADKLDENLFIGVRILPINNGNATKTIQVSYEALFLGRADNLLTIMANKFPELGLARNNCIEMSWIQSVVYIGRFPLNTPPDVLVRPRAPSQYSFKSKSDFFRKPIPEKGLEGLWRMLLKEDAPQVYWFPFGGIMGRISKSQIPFPHRKGVIFITHYMTFWRGEDESTSPSHRRWMRKMYNYMASYATKSPRESYVNYRDLELGRMNTVLGKSSYEEDSEWGVKYFKDSWKRLAMVKSKVDPGDFFWHEQSIPPLEL